MSQVSDYLNSSSDIYYFNIFVDRGKGILKLPFTGDYSQDINVSFRKLEFLPYKTDVLTNYGKSWYVNMDIRNVGETTFQAERLKEFLDLMKKIRSRRLVNVVSFSHYNSKSTEENLFTVDFILISNDKIGSMDNRRLIQLLNQCLKSRGSKMSLLDSVNLLDFKTYPDWLSHPEIIDDNYHSYMSIMYSCYRMNLNSEGGSTTVWSVGNIDSDFKIRTDSKIEVVLNVITPFDSSEEEEQKDLGFSEVLKQTKYRGFNVCILKGCVSVNQVVEASEYPGVEYVLDCFGPVGNLMVHLNRILLNDPDLSFDIKLLKIDKNLLLEGSPYIILNLSGFLEYKNTSGNENVSATIESNTEQNVDLNLDLSYMRISSDNAFRSAVMSRNAFMLEGVLYQGKTSYEAINPYQSNFVTCFRGSNSNEIPFKLELFTNNSFIFGSEVFEYQTGLLIGELVILHSVRSVVDSLY